MCLTLLAGCGGGNSDGGNSGGDQKVEKIKIYVPTSGKYDDMDKVMEAVKDGKPEMTPFVSLGGSNSSADYLFNYGIHLCGRRYVDRTEDVTDITVYTNLGEAELYVDGALFEKKQGERIIRFRVPISGEHTIEARSGDCRDVITVRHATQENSDYKLKGAGILNWFDADGLKADCYNIEDLVSELMKSPGAVKAVMRCVNTRGKDESDFAKELRAEPERLKSLDITLTEMLDRCGNIESNIRRFINAELQRVKRIG